MRRDRCPISLRVAECEHEDNRSAESLLERVALQLATAQLCLHVDQVSLQLDVDRADSVLHEDVSGAAGAIADRLLEADPPLAMGNAPDLLCLIELATIAQGYTVARVDRGRELETQRR